MPNLDDAPSDLDAKGAGLFDDRHPDKKASNHFPRRNHNRIPDRPSEASGRTR